MQGRSHEMIPLIEAGRARQPRSAPSSAPFSHRREASTTLTTRCASSSTPNSPTTSRCSPTPPGSSARCSGPTPPRALGHRPAAMALYQRLLPWHDQFATGPHHGPGGRGALPRTARPHPRPSTTKPTQWFSQALALPRSDGSAVLRRVDPDRMGGPPRRPRPGRATPNEARALAGAALPVATERGYGYVEHDARSLLERIG